MIGVICALLCIISIIASISNGRTSELSQASIESCSEAVKLALSLAGTMALWSGLMRIAEQSGITKVFEKILSPISKRIFKGCCPKAIEYITMNLTANMLGISNAATPLGIAAVKEMDKQGGKYAKRGIAMLTVLNTASIQLLPTTIATMRTAHGANNPYDITLPILIVSLISASAGCIIVYALNLKGHKH